MGRSHIVPLLQPDDVTCGPTALKHALAVLGKRKSVSTLTDLCKTNRNGTTTKHMIQAITELGYSVVAVEYSTLHHLQSALKYRPNQPRAVIVSYLYWRDEDDIPHPETGHWALVSSYLASKSRVVLLDSYTGQKRSYAWSDFRGRWMDYDLKRKRVAKDKQQFRWIKQWQRQLMLVIAKTPEDLPKFSIDTAKVFTPDTKPAIKKRQTNGLRETKRYKQDSMMFMTKSASVMPAA